MTRIKTRLKKKFLQSPRFGDRHCFRRQEAAGSTFVGKNYVPFIVDLKKNGHVQALAYLILYNSGNNLARKWLQVNDTKLKDFLQWGKAYTPAAN